MNSRVIKDILSQKGMTQKKLAEIMQISPSTLSLLLKNPTMSTYQRVAYALGVKVADIIQHDFPETQAVGGQTLKSWDAVHLIPERTEPIYSSRIKAILSVKGLTQKELAGKLGITEAAVSAIINGGDCKTSTLIRVANALDVNLREFFFDIPEMVQAGIKECARLQENDTISQQVTRIICPHCGEEITLNVQK